MKQLTNHILGVEFDIDLDSVREIKFVFVQGSKRLHFTYPSLDAFRQADSNVVCLRWDDAKTDMFDTVREVGMDTYIYLNEGSENPETEIVRFHINPTLFTPEEVRGNA